MQSEQTHLKIGENDEGEPLGTILRHNSVDPRARVSQKYNPAARVARRAKLTYDFAATS